MADSEVFEYTYSAPEKSEVARIREKYLPKEETKLDRLRALDASVTKRGNAISILHGIIFALVLGLGMSSCMMWAGKWFVPGIAIGCIGLMGVAATYPIYHHVVKQEREKIAPEILRLSEEMIFGKADESFEC